jgi:hypothetical protein
MGAARVSSRKRA